MVSYQKSILGRSLPLATFEGLRKLLQQMAQRVGEDTSLNSDQTVGREVKDITLFLTEDVVSSVEIVQKTQSERFSVLISRRFSALLLGTALESDLLTQNSLKVELTFEPIAIAAFLAQLSNLLKNNPFACKTLQTAREILQPNDPTFQSEFTLSLLEMLSPEETPETCYPYVSVCQPLHQALGQQIEQEQLLNRVTTQIRQSLELPVILKTAVEQVRSFLQADRLVIYQFNFNSADEEQNPCVIPPFVQESDAYEVNGNADSNFPLPLLPPALPLPHSPAPPLPHSPAPVPSAFLYPSSCSGRITYEARADDTIPSVLNLAEEAHCFTYVPDCREKYRKGFAIAVEDVETAYVFSPCLLNLMRRTQVRAKLVVPIAIQDRLWGLVIAHQCFEPRQWQDNEKNFLRDIAEHLALAIYQAQLYAEVQQQKQTLEQRVIDRTQELHDAMLAAQSANRAKGEFLSTMSHELRTPLTCVIGLSATLLRWSFGQLSQKQRDYLQTIHDNGEHLLELINDILDLSQLEAGKTVLNFSDFSLSQLAQQSLQIVKEKAQQRGVELAINLRINPIRDRFLADDKRVRQILFNLLSNAIKFTPSGGRVILRVWLENNTAVFQVEDTGIGISEAQIPLLFQKFQQLDTSYHRQYEGTGLGLALTKQLVELHQGRIEVESTVDVGSIFTVWLPLPPSAPVVSDAQIPGSSDIPEGRIVLIENDEETATLICDILTTAGYQMVWIVEGSTALMQIEILQPLVAIVEINLSGMNGYEVIRELRNSPAVPNLKIIAIAATEMRENNFSSLATEPDDYLLKPFRPEQLLHKIANFVIDR